MPELICKKFRQISKVFCDSPLFLSYTHVKKPISGSREIFLEIKNLFKRKSCNLHKLTKGGKPHNVTTGQKLLFESMERHYWK